MCAPTDRWTRVKEGRRYHYEMRQGSYDLMAQGGNWEVWRGELLVAKGATTGVYLAKRAAEDWLECLTERAGRYLDRNLAAAV